MKKIVLLLLTLTLVFALVACGEANAPEPTPAPTPETPVVLPEVLPEEIEEPTPEPEETPLPEETSLPSVPSTSEGVTTANVRVYYVVDENFNQPGSSPHTLIDLGDLDSYHEFIEFEEVLQRIIFQTDLSVENFRFLELEMSEDGLDFTVESTLYQLDVLTPEEPFVVSWWTLSTTRVHRGISFMDEDGVTRYFAFHASGEDGSLFFIEFE